MFKIKTLSLAIFFSTLSLAGFAQSYSAQAILEEIETQKSALKIKIENTEQTVETRRTLRDTYTFLESEEFSSETFDETLSLKIQTYDLEKMYWPVTVTGKIFSSAPETFFEENVNLNYSAVFGKKYSSPDKMSQAQQEDYEFNVDYYNTLFTENPETLNARLYYKVLRWKENSQYCFLPQKLEILKTEKHTQVIAAVEYDFNDRKLFLFNIDSPEIRTTLEYNADVNRADKLVALEIQRMEEIEKEKLQKSKENYKKQNSELRGRRNFIISAVIEEEKFDSSTFDFSTVPFDSVTAHLIFAPAKFVFGGIGFGADINSFTTSPIYKFEAEAGLNLNIANVFLPYAKISGGMITNNSIPLKTGAGADIRLSHFLINIEYNYAWLFDINQNFSHTNFHSISAGIGFNW